MCAWSTALKTWKLPQDSGYANLNTATFDAKGIHWFTGQSGIYGRLDPNTGAIAVFDAPRGTGPYGIAATPDGQVFFASLAGSYLGQINRETGTKYEITWKVINCAEYGVPQIRERVFMVARASRLQLASQRLALL